ncbi:hypothetical protein H3C70_04090 [Patescibacteria group bacterium]|nr:hypothetical protein [Patescibacteria group bacterium]
MSLNGQFGTKELQALLKNLGFTPQRRVGSSHEKWKVPKGTKVSPGQWPFIIVVLNKKQYFKPTCHGYIKELQALGFDIKDGGEIDC